MRLITVLPPLPQPWAKALYAKVYGAAAWTELPSLCIFARPIIRRTRKLVDATKLDPRHLYDLVIQNSNRFLYSCKNFSISVLQLEDPTYAKVAAIMTKVAGIIELLADDITDPLMAQKAHEYCVLMSDMGVAIRDGDHIRLAGLVAELERRSGL